MGTPPVFGTDTATEEGFVVSDEVADVAQLLIDRHVGLQALRDYRIAYLLRHNYNPPADARGVHAIAQAAKAPPLWQVLSEYDGAIWAVADVWAALSERQRQAVILHELLHFFVNDRGSLTILKHDIEEFAQVVGLYGPWHSGLEQFGEQLRLWEGRDHPVADPPQQG